MWVGSVCERNNLPIILSPGNNWGGAHQKWVLLPMNDFCAAHKTDLNSLCIEITLPLLFSIGLLYNERLIQSKAYLPEIRKALEPKFKRWSRSRCYLLDGVYIYMNQTRYIPATIYILKNLTDTHSLIHCF